MVIPRDQISAYRRNKERNERVCSYLMLVKVFFDHFGGHVVGRSLDGFSTIITGFVQLRRDTKVAQFGRSVESEKDICGYLISSVTLLIKLTLDISMNNVLRVMQVAET